MSAVTVADGKLFVAQVDAHTVHALDAGTGERLWHFTTGGRVDSPPTWHAGSVLFGSADGWVTCLRASDGQLAWRFLAAPAQRNGVAFDQVESLWPVHGSVLVKNGVAYAAAGRSSHLDGGIVLYGLDPVTGKVLHRAHVSSEQAGVVPPPPADQRERMDTKISQNSTDYKTFLAPDRSDAFSMRGARSDVLVANGPSVFLRQMRFDAGLVEQEGGSPHVFSTSSLLDGTENHRAHTVFGTGDFSRTPVAYSWIAYSGARHGKSLQVPYGLLLVGDHKTFWGVRRSHLMRTKGKRGKYTLFAGGLHDAPAGTPSLPDFRKPGDGPAPTMAWSVPLGMRPRAMIHADDRLLIGGMADAINPHDASDPVNTVFEGKREGLLYSVSSVDGSVLKRHPLPSPPVWDGMAVAYGGLYMATRGGQVLCLGNGITPPD